AATCGNRRGGAPRPGLAMISRLEDICLESGGARDDVEIAQVHRIRLVGRQAVVAALQGGGGDRRPGPAVIGGRVGESPAAGRGVVQLPKTVGDDRRLSAV